MPTCLPSTFVYFLLVERYLNFSSSEEKSVFVLLYSEKLAGTSTIPPPFGANFCCRNSGSLTFPIQHNPCESRFSAVIRFCSEALFLTSDFNNSPIGTSDFDSVTCESWHRQ